MTMTDTNAASEIDAAVGVLNDIEDRATAEKSEAGWGTFRIWGRLATTVTADGDTWVLGLDLCHVAWDQRGGSAGWHEVDGLPHVEACGQKWIRVADVEEWIRLCDTPDPGTESESDPV